MSTTADAIESEYPVDDTQFRDGVIESVRPSGGGDAPDPARGWVISMVDSWSFYVPPESPVVPTKGMRVRLYGRGLGCTVRGLFLDGRGVFYRTAEEQEEADRKWLDDREKQQRYDFDTKGRAALDMKFAAPPPCFPGEDHAVPPRVAWFPLGE